MRRPGHCLIASGAGLFLIAGLLCGSASGGDENAAQALSRQTPPGRDLSDPDNQALYCVGYAHLDTQWRWDFVTTIDEYVRKTLDDNFALIEKYPDYVFSFTGSVRYEMMKEYYPERYEQLKKYIDEGRWFVSGSSVDEGDVNVPSPESIIRQVLYGNLFFKREFDKESADYMLPDCFGFPASMPSIWAHCGLLGFSTQKLTWGSAVGIPFAVGVWEGPDGESVMAALDPGPYVGAIEGRVDQNEGWRTRVKHNGELYGVWADYHYYGVGDQGGAPHEKDVRNYVESKNASDREMDVVLASSEQLYHDITPEQRAKLPRYSGDMLLTEHSAGTLTSQSYMKRWNRKGEQLADAAERAASSGQWLGTTLYPRKKLERAWVRLLANQMHDILPGTSLPRAYRYSWNDDITAMNQFAQVLTDAVGDVSALLDTNVEGAPLVVYNPLAIERTDAVEATVDASGAGAVRVFDADGVETPSQILGRDGGELHILFMAQAPANGYAVYDVRPSATAFDDGRGPRTDGRVLENGSYKATFDEAGDLASVYDLAAGRELLARPATLQFTHEKPRSFPAWNMDWNDRQHPPTGQVDGAPRWRIVENGPVRAALEVTRKARNSTFTQVYRLTRDDPGRVVETAATIDWQSTECALKASFPLTTANPMATYNWGLGTIGRGNNEPVKYEVPSHEWFDLTQPDGGYGVTILEDSKFGSDKPSDEEVRLTLLYTPGVRNSFVDQHSQDWGVHEIRYGLYGHDGDWREGESEQRGRRFNQPLRAFATAKHAGALGRKFSFAELNTPQADIRAIKLAETRDALIVRVQELWGRPCEGVELKFPAGIAGVEEVDGQERALGTLKPQKGELIFNLTPFEIRSFAIKLAPPVNGRAKAAACTPIELPFDVDVASRDGDRTDGAMDDEGRSYPGEMLPAELVDDNVTFELGGSAPGEMQAVACRGQLIELGDAPGGEIHLLAAAVEDAEAVFRVGDEPQALGVQAWTGFIGQWYDRVWDTEFGEVDFRCTGQVKAILPAFIKRDPVAWFATHRHDPAEGNQAYRFSYLYHYVLPRSDGARTLTLPYDERIRVLAVTVSDGAEAVPAAPLYDDFTGREPIAVRHEYNAVSDTVFTGRKPFAKIESDRKPDYAALSMGAPRGDDDASGDEFAFVDIVGKNGSTLHRGSGAIEGRLVRLNDGEVARNYDDTKRCVWYDGEGRFAFDLHGSRKLAAVSSYSWHRSNRAPQYYSLWGSNAEERPDCGFGPHAETEWKLIAVVDTRKAGDGDIHGVRISGPDGGAIGPYRYLLWINEDRGEGTFFTEIDVDFAE